jgi:hypothetical protein
VISTDGRTAASLAQQDVCCFYQRSNMTQVPFFFSPAMLYAAISVGMTPGMSR